MRKIYEPEGDVLKAQELITWANHLVFVYPTWWAGLPALLRLFFEMVFSPGFAFKYHDRMGKKIVGWDKLLTGKSARIISTMDAPPGITSGSLEIREEKSCEKES
jgi:NAD(P)H dehydrogenase (quinone)